MKVEFRSVLKSYRSLRALDYVSLTIEPGQIVSLLGPNGAGKTTLLRCLTGIASPDSGGVYFDDKEFRRDDIELRRRMYILPDFPFFFWEHTVLRNLAIILRLYEADGDGAETRVAALLREFDLLPLARREVRTLSRGQIYKAGLVAMLAVDPEVWIMDEPFASGMDPLGINAFRQHARAAAGRGRTVIYSTQILDIAERFSDRVCVIHKGVVRAFETMDTLRAQSASKDNVLEELFLQLRDTGE
jgi:ABC-type multidrug transport system ATPase subunit